MFEPGDRVKINAPEEQGKVWTVLKYPWKCWHDMMVTVGRIGCTVGSRGIHLFIGIYLKLHFLSSRGIKGIPDL